eukprot:766677-Hanusia_phi.AAC.3
MSSETSSSQRSLTLGIWNSSMRNREDGVVLSRGQCLFDLADLESIPLEEANAEGKESQAIRVKDRKSKPLRPSSSRQAKSSKRRVSLKRADETTATDSQQNQIARPTSGKQIKTDLSADYFDRSMYGVSGNFQTLQLTDRPRSAQQSGNSRVVLSLPGSLKRRPRSALGSISSTHVIIEDDREGGQKQDEDELQHHQHHQHHQHQHSAPASARPMSALSGMSTRPNSAMHGHGRFLSEDSVLAVSLGKSGQLQTLLEQPVRHRDSVTDAAGTHARSGRSRSAMSSSSFPQVPVVIGKKLDEFSMNNFFEIQMVRWTVLLSLFPVLMGWQAIAAGKRDLRRLQIQSQVAHDKKREEEREILQLQVEKLKREFNRARSSRVEKENLLARKREETERYLAEVLPNELLNKKIESLQRANDDLWKKADKEAEKSLTLQFMLSRLEDLVDEETKMLQLMKEEIARVSSLNQTVKQRCGVVKHNANLALSSLKAKKKLINYDHCSWNLHMSKRRAREEKETAKLAQIASQGSEPVQEEREEEGEEVGASRRGKALYRLLDHEEKVREEGGERSTPDLLSGDEDETLEIYLQDDQHVEGKQDVPGERGGEDQQERE